MVSLGDTENCGCFGELIALSPLESVAKNLILLLMAAILYKKSRFQKRAPKTVMILSFFFLVIPWVQLPIQVFDLFVFNDPEKELFDFRIRVCKVKGRCFSSRLNAVVYIGLKSDAIPINPYHRGVDLSQVLV